MVFNLSLAGAVHVVIETLVKEQGLRLKCRCWVEWALLAKRGIRSPIRLPIPKSGIPEIPEPFLQRARKHLTPTRSKAPSKNLLKMGGILLQSGSSSHGIIWPDGWLVQFDQRWISASRMKEQFFAGGVQNFNLRARGLKIARAPGPSLRGGTCRARKTCWRDQIAKFARGDARKGKFAGRGQKFAGRE
ncbi:hypothetical protein B0H11DRAFT_1909215 [Mycena galericulata]|nr:hypothetical protein B0H11DRAFT_1909215 [Mycena galericulata]